MRKFFLSTFILLLLYSCNEPLGIEDNVNIYAESLILYNEYIQEDMESGIFKIWPDGANFGHSIPPISVKAYHLFRRYIPPFSE